MGVRTLADGNVKVVLLPDKPADTSAITVAEAAAGKDVSCRILSSDFDLGPTGSTMLEEKPLCVRGNAQSLGPSNFGGGWSLFRYFDPTTGQPDAADDEMWDATKDKGSVVHLLVREDAQESAAPIVADDEYRYYEVATDDYTRGDRTGWVKWRQTPAVQAAVLDKRIVAGGD